MTDLRTTFIGLDPGNSSGGIAVVGANGQAVSTLTLSRATVHDVVALLGSFRGSCGLALLERVSAMPKQGVASSFRFGVSFGQLQGILASNGIRWEEVTPAKWQQAMKCRSKGDKNVTKAAAQRLFPDLKVTHATADALLLAEHARRVYAERSVEVLA